jgi:hypothetical protein
MPITDPDWTDPIEATFDPGKAIRSEQGLMLAGNTIAMALMKTGSPVILANWHPYNMVTAGDGATGEIWSHAVDGAVSEIETPDFDAGYEYQVNFQDVSNSAGSATLRVEAYFLTSSAYSTAIDILALPGSPVNMRLSGFLDILRAFDADRTHVAPFVIGGSNTTASGLEGGSNPPGASGAVLFSHATAQRIGRMKVSISTGTMNGGRVRLFRRKTYG